MENIKQFHILVAGSRGLDNDKIRRQVRGFVEMFQQIHDEVRFVTGCARSGGDIIARELAHDMNLDIKVFVAEWDLLGKSAGMRRNEAMIDHIMNFYPMCCVLAIHDGVSRGTMHTISLARRFKIPHYVIKI